MDQNRWRGRFIYDKSLDDYGQESKLLNINEKGVHVRRILCFLFMVIGVSLFAQTTGGYQSANNASAYSYTGTMSGQEKLKIYTHIWGQVSKPGLYIVPDDTDLMTLLSLAGGPKEDAKLTRVRIIRPTSSGNKIIWVNLKQYMDTGDEKLIPVMQPGDTVILSGTVFYAFTRVTDFLSKVAIALSLYNTVHSIN